jgi:hypothetical protein
MISARKNLSIRTGALLAAALAVFVFAIPARAADPVFPAGSRIGLIPPPGMRLSNNFEGFEDPDKNAAILLATFPADAFAHLDKSMVPDALQKQGIDIEKREPFQAAGGNGFLLSGKQASEKAHFRKLMLVVPAGNVTALVTVQTLEQDNTYPEAVMRAALATLAARDSIPDAERMSLLPFTVGDFAGFHIDDVLPGRALMLVDAPAGKAPAQAGPAGAANANSDAPWRNTNARLLIAAMQGGPAEAADRDNFARQTFAQLGGIGDVNIQDAEPLRIGNQPGYEILANGKDPESGSDLKVVQWLRFGTGGYMQIVGVARAELWPDAFTRMRTVRDSVDSK